MGLEWQGIPERLDPKRRRDGVDIVIGCVDTRKAGRQSPSAGRTGAKSTNSWTSATTPIAEDYLPHIWFDESKAFLPDFRHRALRHHAEGIFLTEKLFGVAIVNSDGKQVPVRYLGEQHVREDLGRIPSAQDWLVEIKPQRWMYGQSLEKEEATKKERA